MMNWAEYEEERIADRRRTILPLIGWGAGIAVILAFAAALSGCATTEEPPKVCFIKFMGQTSDGMSVVAQQCMTPEAFAETQK